ncbi:DUF4145 domain-containing protein [Mesorhizobium sp. AR02]|uniref:DUF4145 domain-containing protein n=1 Tax=Mesorhizobium sp. AR02 TaxID=2865837 RepID=UPI00215ED486|nr:DUF4145 domain-containing protein [Mesorhizobium sp. AR02]UVK53416.1 DUF4145 domain-containing protein [Mesorhizobium sp. AR02]
MGFLVRDCIRCGVKHVKLDVVGFSTYDVNSTEVFAACESCQKGSIYDGRPDYNPFVADGNLEAHIKHFSDSPITAHPFPLTVSDTIPSRVRDLFLEATTARRLQLNEAAGAMFRKTIDVATKHIFSHDARLSGRTPAEALRPRINALGALNILEADIVELADVVVLDGNDAAHDVDPYTADEVEVLEELTNDLLERLFVRPARVAAVKAKQIAAGVRKP